MDDMKLPDGKTCADCLHCNRCEILYNNHPSNTTCDFSPSKFYSEEDYKNKSMYDNAREYAVDAALSQPDPILYYRDRRGGEEEHF